MSATFLLDFGASRIKCALWSAGANSLSAEIEVPAPQPALGSGGKVEVDPEAYWRAIEATVGTLVTRHPEVSSVWICSEMHGVIAADMKGNPITPYISWRDERSTFATEGGQTTFDALSELDKAFFAKSGMRLRPGLPFLTLAHLRRKQAIGTVPIRLFTLVDWLLWRGGERDPAIHASLAAGTGLYDIHDNDWSGDLIQAVGLAACHVATPRVLPAGAILGKIDVAGRRLSVFGGLGDLQAAAFGVGFPRYAGMAVNLGTGSQVLAQDADSRLDFEARPAADGAAFSAITHIPSGRALNVFAACIDGFAAFSGGRPCFWDLFASLRPDEILECPVEVQPAVFAAAWNYQGGGTIGRIHEVGFTSKQLLAGIAKGWLSQYIHAMDLLDPDRTVNRFLVAGGLSRRAAFVLPCLSAMSGRLGIQSEIRTGEETLDGLLALAEMHGHEG